jgi:hypothetical protein
MKTKTKPLDRYKLRELERMVEKSAAGLIPLLKSA